MTPDGPRGPLYKVKPGIAMAAKEAQATIIPLTWDADHFWELKTWDKLKLPKPFTCIRVVLGDPIKVDQDPSLDTLKYRLQCSLESL